MSREIKFRAWDKANSWFIENFDYVRFSDGTLGVSDSSPPFNKHGETILMQYTGLKDKNGVEIYEGDIVRIKKIPKNSPAHWNYHHYFVEWDNISARIIFRPVKPTLSHGTVSPSVAVASSHVIGNIYENPELLEK